jgi:hypothetical protein
MYPTSFYVRGVLTALTTPGAATAETVIRVREDQEELIAGMIALAQGKPSQQGILPWSDPKYNAVRLLGDLRATQAVKPLFGQLGYTVEQPAGSFHDRFGYGPAHPAAEALAKIGKPASTIALQALNATPDPEEARALVWILDQVEGPDLTKYLISQQQARYKRPPDSENLARALGLVDEMAGK